MIHLIVPGEAVPQGRARFSSKNGFVRTYDPKNSSRYKAFVRAVANQIMKQPPLEGPLVMMVDVHRGVPKSWRPKQKEQALAGFIKPTSKPDCSNYLKGIEDALNGVAYLDDSQLVLVIVRKKYSAEPRVEIRIWEDTDENNEKYYREGTNA